RGSGGGRHGGWDSLSPGDLHRLVTVDAPLLLGSAVSTGRVIDGHFGDGLCSGMCWGTAGKRIRSKGTNLH
ncbi:hypothetical protein ACN38_g10931, partial [Penicillium nordicum]